MQHLPSRRCSLRFDDPMGNHFQLYNFLARAIPVSVYKTEELENAVRVSIALAVHASGTLHSLLRTKCF